MGRKRRRQKSFDPLNNVKTKIRKKEKEIKGELVEKRDAQKFRDRKKRRSDAEKKKVGLLDAYVLDMLKTMGHPDKVLMSEIEENIAMKQIIKEEISELRNSRMRDEDGNIIFDHGLGAMMDLFRKFSMEIRQGLKDIRDTWKDVSDSELDEEIMEAYKNMTYTLEFFDTTEPQERTFENFMQFKERVAV